MGRKLFLMSSSAVHGFSYLEHAEMDMTRFFRTNGVKKVLFIPYALTDYDGYTERVGSVLKRWGYLCHGIHTFADPIEAVKDAEAIYIGGGNTFLLLRTLYEKKLIDTIRDRVLNHGIPYVGSSAGTNVATRSIHTTNDMPIVFTPSFDALALVPFNINPHYIDPDVNGKHMGETREERIRQFHELNDAPVLGLREGTTLHVSGNDATLIAPPIEKSGPCYDARLFRKDQKPVDYAPLSSLSFLLKEQA